MLHLICAWLIILPGVFSALTLRFATGVGRHSIKAEDLPPASYYQYLSKNFIDADGKGNRGSGNITSRGQTAAKYLGYSLADVYGSKLFPNVCKNSGVVKIYADAKYFRCVDTAMYIAKGMQYQCDSFSPDNTPVKNTGSNGQFTGPGSIYRLLSEGQNDNRYTGCGLSSYNETVGEYGAKYEASTMDGNGAIWGGVQQFLRQNMFYEMKTLSDAVGFSSSTWCKSNPTLCITKTFLDIPTIWDGSYFKPWSGGWDVAKAITNAAYFQAAEGKSILNGTMTVDEALRVKRLQVELIYSYINQFNIRSWQQDLPVQILALLEQAVTGVTAGKSEVQAPASSTFVLFVGHDANVAALLRWLGASSQPFAQPKNTPGYITYLFFELWQDGSSTGDYFVRVVSVAPPVQTLRDAVDPLTLPTDSRWSQYRSIVEVPGCAVKPHMMCPYVTFKRLLTHSVMDQLRPACISSDHLDLLLSLQGMSPTTAPTTAPTASPTIRLVMNSVKEDKDTCDSITCWVPIVVLTNVFTCLASAAVVLFILRSSVQKPLELSTIGSP